MVDGVEGRHVGEQRLGGADVAGGLVAADVLLARLQRHAVGDVAGGVVAGADDAARAAVGAFSHGVRVVGILRGLEFALEAGLPGVLGVTDAQQPLVF